MDSYARPSLVQYTLVPSNALQANVVAALVQLLLYLLLLAAPEQK